MKSNNANTNSVVYSTEPEDFYWMDINVPCQAACPACTNIPAYIQALHEEQYGQSYEINRLVNILPGILGRICSRPCENKCRHGESELGQPVNICHIKRAAADLQEKIPQPVSEDIPVLDKKVAIIGSGPAGLAAAHDLAAFGVDVTIYEAMAEPGGMLRYGIPEFRLPREMVRSEIDSILKLGIDLKTNIMVGSDLALEELVEKHDAVLLAAGCYQANKLDLPGEDLPGVYHGLEFMMDVCKEQPPELGRRVLVIGAGFTAFDCARSALRLGSKDVRICLRRTEEDLVVTSDEILAAKAEGIRFESLLLSHRIIGQGKVEGMEFVRTLPGELREDGKRRVTAIEGSEFILPADTIIVATGQKPVPYDIAADKDASGVPVADGKTYQTSMPGLYIAGDYLSGPSTVIEAIAMGRRAAGKIAEDIGGRRFLELTVRMEETKITDRQRSWDFIPRQEMPTVDPGDKRLTGMACEVEIGYDRDMAAEEAKRCYLCNLHYEIDLSRCIYCRYCIDVAPRDCIKLVEKVETNDVGAITNLVETNDWHAVNAVVIDNQRCIRCGECMRVCPVDCISVTRVELVEKMAQPEAKNG
ncbi:MAG: FAD-dependent oxidoreductase [Thermodesulfobacteriota bacterium]